jgi:hypothetical protein
LTIHVTQHGKAVKGVRVKIRGPRLNLRTKPSNAHGVIKHVVKLRKAGVMIFSPTAGKKCSTKRVGVTGVFTPPVTCLATPLEGVGAALAPLQPSAPRDRGRLSV